MKAEANANRPLTTEQKEEIKKNIADHIDQIIHIAGFDRENDPNLTDTPMRVAKALVDELWTGCFTPEPKITVFPNTKQYNQMIISGPIDVKSMCSHHWLPFIGRAWVGYIPGGHVCGLSKLSRIVDWFARRPQIQEELTEQILEHVVKTLNPIGAMVIVEAKHFCMCSRGVNQNDSVMVTSAIHGAFEDAATRNEFMNLIKR